MMGHYQSKFDIFQNFGLLLHRRFKNFLSSVAETDQCQIMLVNPDAYKVVRAGLRGIVNSYQFLSPGRRLHAERTGFAVALDVLNKIDQLMGIAADAPSPDADATTDQDASASPNESD